MNYPITVTLSDLRKKGAYFESYNKVVRSLQGLPFTCKDSIRKSYIRYAHKGDILLSSIVHSNCLDNALWALRCIPGIERDARLFAVWCARRVQHLMTSPHSLIALDIATLYANGRATDMDLTDAWVAARDAARAAQNADEWDASRAAVWVTSKYAPQAAEQATLWASDRDTEEEAQKAMFIKMCEGRAPWQETARDMERS
jgi:hypothetical protein